MNGYLIALFVLIVFLVVIVFAVLNNSRHHSHHWDREPQQYQVSSPKIMKLEFPTSSLEPYPVETLIPSAFPQEKGKKEDLVEPPFEYVGENRSEPMGMSSKDPPLSEASYNTPTEQSRKDDRIEETPIYPVSSTLSSPVGEDKEKEHVESEKSYSSRRED